MALSEKESALDAVFAALDCRSLFMRDDRFRISALFSVGFQNEITWIMKAHTFFGNVYQPSPTNIKLPDIVCRSVLAFCLHKMPATAAH